MLLVRRMFVVFSSASVLLLSLFSQASVEGLTPARRARTGVFGKLPLRFELNRGQTDPSANFVARGAGYTLLFTPQGVVVSSAQGDVRLRFEGASQATLEGVEPLPGRSNYFVGADRSAWKTDVPQYAKVRYRDAYPGVDVIFYGNQRQLEYDFVVAPGADPRAIRLTFEGSGPLRITPEGELAIPTPGGEMRQHRPNMYQEMGGARQRVEGRYVLLGEKRAGFEVTAFDRSRPLVIDPVLSYSTYLGGIGDDASRAIAVDATGAVYLAGRTTSVGLPTTSPIGATSRGGVDAFVLKLNAAGDTIVYATYLGGAQMDSAWGIAVDAAGNAYVVGETTSADFPTVHPYQAALKTHDAFIAKLNPSGNALVYSTYLGGSGSEWGLAIAVDASGSAYVAGVTQSADFPVKNPISGALGGTQDAFVSKLAADGSTLVYSTYLGGSGGEDTYAIAVDSAGNAYVTGVTGSNAFPTVNPLQSTRGGGLDAYVSKLNPAGSALVFSTYLGGNDDEEGSGIAVDSAGNVYVAGDTYSTNFPLANAAQGTIKSDGSTADAFVTKLNATGSALVYSTYLGGSGDDLALGIALDAAGNAYVTGGTGSADFPVSGAIQPSRGFDAFVTQYSPTGAITFSTWFGGSGYEYAQAIAVDAQKNIYITGLTDSSDLPTVGAIQPSYGGANSTDYGDGFVAKISTSGTAIPGLSLVSAASFSSSALAPDSIVSAYGSGLASDLVVPPAGSFPETLGDASVRVIDSAGADRAAQLYFVSPGQINFVVPAGTATGTARIRVIRAGQTAAEGTAQINPVAPGLFAANANGKGVAAALWLRVGVGGAQTSGPIFQCPSAGNCSTAPIDLGPDTDQVFLLLFGTGIRGRSGASGVTATIGAEPAEVQGALAQGQYPGFDQVNLRIPRTLIGRGEVNIALTVDGKAANIVTASIGGTAPPLIPQISSLSPANGTQGQTISPFTINGQNLTGATTIEFSPPDDISVSILEVYPLYITARLTIGANAVTGTRTVTVVSPSGRSNTFNFEVRAPQPLPTSGDYLLVKTGLVWDYRVTFPSTVQVPYLPIVEDPAGLLCASIFCGTKQWAAGQINFRVTVNELLGSIGGGDSYHVTVVDPGSNFYFALSNVPMEMRVRPVNGKSQLEIISTIAGIRLVRPLARPTDAELAQKQSLSVPAGDLNNVVRTTVTLTGDNIYVKGTYTTEVFLAPGIGLVKAVMRDSSGNILYTQELTGFAQPAPAPSITSLSPTNGTQGQTISNFTISGQNLSGVTSIDFSPATGVTVSNLQATATSVTAQLAIAANAATGTRTVTVTSPDGKSNSLSFEVRTGTPPVTPSVSSLIPKAGITGQELASFTIFGENLKGVTAIEFSPPDGITVTNLSASSTSVSGALKIASDAPAGDRTVTVAAGETRSNSLTFKVIQADRLFTISDLSVSAVNKSRDADVSYSLNFDDPTGSACQADVSVLTTIGGQGFSEFIVSFGYATLTCDPGTTKGKLTKTTTVTDLNFRTGIDIPFSIYLTNDLGVRSNELKGTFRVQ